MIIIVFIIMIIIMIISCVADLIEPSSLVSQIIEINADRGIIIIIFIIIIFIIIIFIIIIFIIIFIIIILTNIIRRILISPNFVCWQYKV